MRNTVRVLIFFFLGINFTSSLLAQPFGPPTLGPTFPTDDQVVKNLYNEAMDSSRLPMHAHELLDVIGPRLIGSPSIIKANNWLVAKYQGFGIEAKNEKYGEWRGWDRGITHIDLLQPRVRTLEGTQLSWSPATKSRQRAKSHLSARKSRVFSTNRSFSSAPRRKASPPRKPPGIPARFSDPTRSIPWNTYTTGVVCLTMAARADEVQRQPAIMPKPQ